MSHSRKVAQIDARAVNVHFSPAVTSAFGDLEAAVHSSGHFDKDLLRTVQELAAGQDKSVHAVLISLPAIAAETMNHIRSTGDRRAERAWDDITAQMNENGFSLTQVRGRRESPG
jgi:hypothetical protein